MELPPPPPPPGNPPAGGERLNRMISADSADLPPPPKFSMISFGSDADLSFPPPPPSPSEFEPLFEDGIEDGDRMAHPPPIEPFHNVIRGMKLSPMFKDGQVGRAEIVVNKPKVVSAEPKLIVPKLRKVEKNDSPPEEEEFEFSGKTGRLMLDIAERELKLREEEDKKNKKLDPPTQNKDFTDLPDIEDDESDYEEEMPPPKSQKKEVSQPPPQSKPKPAPAAKAAPEPFRLKAAPAVPAIKDEPMRASPYDQQVFEWINRVRSDPASLVPHLEERLKKFVDGTKNFKSAPGVQQVTREGKDAVQEAIDFLNNHKPLSTLKWNNDIAQSGKEFVLEAGPIGKLGHQGEDGSEPQDRVKKLFPQMGAAAEGLKYYSNDPLQLILSQIIDDGVASRGNRRHVFGKWDYFGCYTGEHKTMESMTALLYVQSQEFGDNIIQEAIAAFEREMGEPAGWAKKSQKVSIQGSNIYITNTYIMGDGTTKVVTNKE